MASGGREEYPLGECVAGLREPRGRRWIVYLLLSMVPPGYAVTYGVLAALSGSSPRGVGALMRSNRCLILVPCHRVVARRGLGGFSRGLDFKLRLLRLEGWASGRVIDGVEEFWELLEAQGESIEVDP